MPPRPQVHRHFGSLTTVPTNSTCLCPNTICILGYLLPLTSRLSNGPWISSIEAVFRTRPGMVILILRGLHSLLRLQTASLLDDNGVTVAQVCEDIFIELIHASLTDFTFDGSKQESSSLILDNTTQTFLPAPGFTLHIGMIRRDTICSISLHWHKR